jgi:hypothetical protein
MIYIGMDVHQSSTTFCLYDPSQDGRGRFRTLTRPTTAEAIVGVLVPLNKRCRVAFEIGTQAQWVAQIVRPLAADVQVANASRMPWLFRDGRKNDTLDARKLATLLHLGELPQVHLPAADVSAWRALIEPHLPPDKSGTRRGGRPPADKRTIVNGLMYFARSGCQWRMLPREFGPWPTVHH